MSALELVITMVFIVPIIAACLLFVLCASWMQTQENQSSGKKQGLAESAY